MDNIKLVIITVGYLIAMPALFTNRLKLYFIGAGIAASALLI